MNTSDDLRLSLNWSKFSASSNSILRSADSTIAVAFGSLYLRSRSLPKEPALTPIRMGIFRSLQALTTDRTRSLLPIFPGLIRKQSTPSSATLSAILWSKWISETKGTDTCRRISPKASAASKLGTETRTISAPTDSRRLICATVASTSSVLVLVILWTAIGASPPTGTGPTIICFETRLVMFDACRTIFS